MLHAINYILLLQTLFETADMSDKGSTNNGYVPRELLIKDKKEKDLDSSRIKIKKRLNLGTTLSSFEKTSNNFSKVKSPGNSNNGEAENTTNVSMKRKSMENHKPVYLWFQSLRYPV